MVNDKNTRTNVVYLIILYNEIINTKNRRLRNSKLTDLEIEMLTDLGIETFTNLEMETLMDSKIEMFDETGSN